MSFAKNKKTVRSAAGDLFVRRCLEHGEEEEGGKKRQLSAAQPSLCLGSAPLSVFQTIRQDSWPSDLTSCLSLNHQVTYAQPACTAAVTDTRTAGTSARHKGLLRLAVKNRTR